MDTEITTNQDRELVLLSEIESNQSISQRELSQKSGLSLGSVNILLKKMVRQGLVKMETIPANRIVYMLTPAGIAEKTYKTLRYIKAHYKAIEDTKRQIMESIRDMNAIYDTIYVVEAKDELQDLFEQSVLESKDEQLMGKVIYLSGLDALCQYKSNSPDRAVVLYFPDDPDPDLPALLERCAPEMTHMNLFELL